MKYTSSLKLTIQKYKLISIMPSTLYYFKRLTMTLYNININCMVLTNFGKINCIYKLKEYGKYYTRIKNLFLFFCFVRCPIVILVN